MKKILAIIVLGFLAAAAVLTATSIVGAISQDIAPYVEYLYQDGATVVRFYEYNPEISKHCVTQEIKKVGGKIYDIFAGKQQELIADGLKN